MEITIGDFTYRTGKLTPYQQFHVARRLAPMLSALGKAAEGANDGGKLDSLTDTAALMAVFAPVADAVSKMSDSDSEYVINACMDSCHRRITDDKWAPVRVAGRLMFEDMGLKDLIQITINTIQENLGNFFDARQA